MDNFEKRMTAYFEQFNKEKEYKEIGNEEFSIEKTVKHIAKKFTNDWKTSYDYTKAKYKIYESVPLNPKVKADTFFERNVVYIEALYNSLSKDDYIIPDIINNELTEWEIKGGLCIYLSILLYSMMIFEKRSCTDCTKLVQGFVTHEIRKDYPSYLPWNGRHILLHSWVTLEGAIVDIAINQQYPFFDFNEPFTMGKIQDGLTYVGFEESKETVEKYVKEILEFSKMTFTEWIVGHLKCATLVFLEYLRD